MSYVVVWTDKLHSRTFSFTAAGVQGHHFEKRSHEKHPHANDTRAAHDEQNRFFSELAAGLKEATELLIVGPGVGKNQFANYLEVHSPHDLFKKVVGIEPLDDVTDPQIVAFAKKYFRVNHDFWTVS